MAATENLRATVLGFGGALIVLVVLFALVGVGGIVKALSMANPVLLGLVLLMAVCWLSSWGLALRTVLGVLDAPINAALSVLIFAGAIFADNVTPFGQAGGEPVSAVLISRATDRQYETGLAAIATVDALNFVPSIALALVGLAYFTTQLTFGRSLEIATTVVIALAVVVPIAVVLAWRNRYRLEDLAVGALTPLFQWLGGAIPGRSPPTENALRTRVEGFFGTIDRIADDPRGVALTLCFSTLGWLFLSGSLWCSLFALGHRVPFAAVIVVVPAGAIASITPLPGGFGGIEVVIATLLVPTTGVAFSTATAAVVIHRAATFLLPTIVGGGVTTMFADR